MVLLLVGPATAVIANLFDVRIGDAFQEKDQIVKTLTYYVFGASVGLIVQGSLALGFDRVLGRGEVPLSRRDLAACGVIDVLAIVAWLFAILEGDTALVLALGALTPIVVSGWEIASGKLGARRRMPAMFITLLGGISLSLTSEGVLQRLSVACLAALIIRNLLRAVTEVWERKVPDGASYRFTGVRFAWMCALGIPFATLALAAMDEVETALRLVKSLSPAVIALLVASHSLWFFTNVMRVQAKQHLKSVIVPTAAFTAPGGLAALVAALIELARPGSFPRLTFSFPLLIGALLLVLGAVGFAALRAGERAQGGMTHPTPEPQGK